MDAKSKTEPQGLFHQIKSAVFIAAFYTAKHLFGYSLGLSCSLQGSTRDDTEAYKHITVVKDQLQDIRNNAETVFFSSVYEKIKKMAKIADIRMTIPRTCGRQTTLMPRHQSHTFDAHYLFTSLTTCCSN